ncbi:helix-turn-helix domain-containing protein [Streptomyces sp. NBC_00470]|uniref:helix-turn-helix domain-containing protein n=1 Tax=Streptomyces sp. NBC_00470 TaxID=2975753 RepID=UPI0030E30370
MSELRKKGITQGALADLTGLDQSTVSKIAHGRIRLTDYEKIVRFLDGLGVPQELSPVALPGKPPPSRHTTATWDTPGEIAADLSRTMETNTTREALDLVEVALQDILSSYEADGPTGPLRLAHSTAELRRSLTTLTEGHHPASLRARLFQLLAQTSAALGYMAVNAARPAHATAYCTAARTLAQDIGDTTTLMWTHGTLSLNAYYQGAYEHAETHARTGIALAPHHPQSVRLLSNGTARALAKLGDPRAGDDIQEALRLSDQHGLDDGLTPCISLAPYGRARTLANALTAQVALHSPAMLVYETEIASAIEAADSAWSRSLVTLDLAAAQLDADPPEVEHAMILGERALEAHRQAPPILSVHRRAHELHRQAQPWAGHPAVEDFAQALHQMELDPAGRDFKHTARPSRSDREHHTTVDALRPRDPIRR